MLRGCFNPAMLDPRVCACSQWPLLRVVSASTSHEPGLRCAGPGWWCAGATCGVWAGARQRAPSSTPKGALHDVYASWHGMDLPPRTPHTHGLYCLPAWRMPWPCSLAGHVPVMEKCALKMRALLERAAGEERPVDIFSEWGRMTLAVMGECGFG